MKCKNCGGELQLMNGIYQCDSCGSTFRREELSPAPVRNNEFRIVGGVLTAYCGNSAVVLIPEGVLSIGREAFKNNVAVRKVIFSSTVTAIENNAFESCTNLTEITGYENVAKFGDECFKFAGLSSVTVGPNVTHLGANCFSRMPNLTSVTYMPGKNIKLNHTFAFCQQLIEVEQDHFYFFPSVHSTLEVRNNPGNQRPTLFDAFVGTPFMQEVFNQYMAKINQGICPECGGQIKHGLFHTKCTACGIDYKN